MTAPDRFDQDGQPVPDRRQGDRRASGSADHPPPEVLLGYEAWVRLLVVHRGRIIAVVGSVCGAMGVLATILGLRIYGPPQEIAELRGATAELRGAIARRDSLVDARVGKIEDSVAVTRQQIGSLATAVEFQSYVLCVLIRRNDPDAVPPGCPSTNPRRSP